MRFLPLSDLRGVSTKQASWDGEGLHLRASHWLPRYGLLRRTSMVPPRRLVSLGLESVCTSGTSQSSIPGPLGSWFRFQNRFFFVFVHAVVRTIVTCCAPSHKNEKSGRRSNMLRTWRMLGSFSRSKPKGWTCAMQTWKMDGCRAESGGMCSTSEAVPYDEEGERKETKENTRSKCWSCASSRGPKDTFFCRACEIILPPDSDKNFFELLGIGQPSLQVDVKELEQIYRDLQKRLHPDKFSKAGPKEKELSEQQASLVNAAYHTLKTPLGRLRYLLQVLEEVPDVSEATIQDPEMLMEVMEAREQVENTDDKEKLKTIQRENQAKFDDLYSQASKAYQEKNIEALMDLTNRMIYVAKVEEEILAKL